MVTEDFSFPRLAESPSTVMPFLWGARRAGDGREDQKLRRNSFPRLGKENERRRGGGPGDGMSDGEGEEKMDVLWEDFNQAELQFGAGSGEKAELSRVQERTDGGVVVARKRAAVASVLKIMRKLFLLHSSLRLRKASSLRP